MHKRTETKRRTQGESSTTPPALSEVMAPLVAGMTTTRRHLLEWVQAAGLVALDAVFRDDAESLAGPKGKHTPTRTHHHWGTTAREVTFGGRRLSVPCPRVRGLDGREAMLPAIAAFRERDPLTTRVMEQLLVGVSTRGYARSLEAPPAGGRARGSSKSAVSRVVVARTRAELAQQLSRRLDTLDVVALFLDGVVVAQQTVIVALAVARDGTKEPLGLCLGSTENAAICTQLLQDLLARGLRIEERVLGVIDGGKGLRKALADVLGAAAVIQRCQLHKRRNLEALVPKARHAYLRAALQRAYRASSPAAARRQLHALALWLERTGHPDAAASLREGLEETLTILKLGLPPTLRRFFVSTNCIENLVGTLRHVARNVKRWRDGEMIRRWVGLGLVRAAACFRRIKGHRDLATLAAVLRAEPSSEHVA